MTEPRLLWVTNLWPTPERPAFGAFVRAQWESLAALGVRPEIVVFAGGGEGSGVPRGGLAKYVRGMRELLARVRDRAYDLVHAHYGLTGLCALATGVPAVVSFCGNDVIPVDPARGPRPRERLAIAASRLAARGAAACIAKSPALAEALADHAARPPVVIPNGVDFQRFAPADRDACRDRLGWASDEAVVGFPADPAVPRKGFEIVAAAVRQLCATGRRVRLQALWGRPHAAMPALLNACDALALASSSEGSPNVIKEALACNRPVVCTPVGDVPALLSGVGECRLVARTPEAFARALAAVLDGPGASNGRQALQDLRAERVAARILEVYAGVLARSPWWSNAAPPSSVPSRGALHEA